MSNEKKHYLVREASTGDTFGIHRAKDPDDAWGMASRCGEYERVPHPDDTEVLEVDIATMKVKLVLSPPSPSPLDDRKDVLRERMLVTVAAESDVLTKSNRVVINALARIVSAAPGTPLANMAVYHIYRGFLTGSRVTDQIRALLDEYLQLYGTPGPNLQRHKTIVLPEYGICRVVGDNILPSEYGISERISPYQKYLVV